VTEMMAARSKGKGDAIAVLPAALVLVLSGTLAYLGIRQATMHTWRFIGDVDAAVALVVLGGLAFPAATVFACRIDGLANPRLTDHFRQSALLYAGVVVGALVLATRVENQGSLGYAIGTIGATAALIGIVANAVTLAVRSRRARAI
jgi:hypothetical protein